MAEIHSNWCQSGDMQQEILIVRNVSIYFTRGYITEVLHGQRMFNTMFKKSGFSRSNLTPNSSDLTTHSKYLLMQHKLQEMTPI